MSKKIAILATNGFEESELKSPKRTFRTARLDSTYRKSESGTIKLGQKKTGEKNMMLIKP